MAAPSRSREARSVEESMREKQAGMRGEILTIGYERATPAGLVAARS